MSKDNKVIAIKAANLKTDIGTLLHTMYRCHNLNPDAFATSIKEITTLCMQEIENHAQLIDLLQGNNSLRFFVQQMILETYRK